MQGKWLTPTRKAIVRKVRQLDPFATVVYNGKTHKFDLGWMLMLNHGDMFDYETFWYPEWQMAVKAIPQLWRH